MFDYMQDPRWAQLDADTQLKMHNAYIADIKQPEEEKSGLNIFSEGLAAGTLGLAESVGTGVEYLGQRTGSETIAEIGKTASDYWEKKAEAFAPPESIAGKNIVDDPELITSGDYWLYNLGQTAPSLMASLIPGVGASRFLAAGPAAIARLSKLGGALTGGATGGFLEAAPVYKEVLKQGGTEKEAARASEAMILFATALNSLGTGKILDTAGANLKAKALKTVGAAGWEGLTEGLEEPAAVLSKYLGKYLAGEKLPGNLTEQIVASLKDAATVAPIAAVTGGGASVLVGSSKNIQDAKTVDEAVEAFEEKVTPTPEVQTQTAPAQTAPAQTIPAQTAPPQAVSVQKAQAQETPTRVNQKIGQVFKTKTAASLASLQQEAGIETRVVKKDEGWTILEPINFIGTRQTTEGELSIFEDKTGYQVEYNPKIHAISNIDAMKPQLRKAIEETPPEAAEGDFKAKGIPQGRAPSERPLPKASKVRTLRGAIKQLGGIDFLNYTGELKDLEVSVKRSIAKKGALGIDQAVEELKAEGWLDQDTDVASFLEELRTDPKGLLSRDKIIGRELSEKKPHELSAREKRLKEQLEQETEAPPSAEYKTMNAEDLPIGKKMTLLEDKTSRGWDIYEVVATDDPFEVVLQDGEKVTLGPLDRVQVMKKDLPGKEMAPAESPLSKAPKKRTLAPKKRTLEPVKEPAEEMKKIGQEQGVMTTTCIVAETHEEDGVIYELYRAKDEKDKSSFVRIYDTEAKELVGIKKYPTLEQAKVEYDKAAGVVPAKPRPPKPAKPKPKEAVKGESYEKQTKPAAEVKEDQQTLPLTERRVNYTKKDIQTEFPQIISDRAGSYKSGVRSIVSPADAAAFAHLNLAKYPQEHFVSVVLDKDNKIISAHRYSIGTESSSQVSPAIIAGHILNTAEAASVVFVHNHPSGRSTLSADDINVFKSLQNILKGTKVKARDLLAVGKNEYSSFMEGENTRGDIPDVKAKYEIPLVERVFETKGKNLYKISGSGDVKKFAKENLPKGGLILLNSNNHVVGTLPLQDYSRLRKGISESLLKQMDATNASRLLVCNLKGKIKRSYSDNLKKFANAASLTLLDIIDIEGSRGDLGDMPTTSDTKFFSAKQQENLATQLYQKREVPKGMFVHGRAGRQDLNTGSSILATNDWDVADQYADETGSKWLIEPNADSKVLDTDEDKNINKILDALFDDYHNGNLPSYELEELIQDGIEDNGSEEAFREKLYYELAPADIVDSAAVWEDHSFVTWFWDKFQYDIVVWGDGEMAALINPAGVATYKVDEAQYSTKATKPQGTITKADLRDIFSEMKNVDTGINEAGNFFFRVAGKPAVEILEVDHIEGYVQTSSGRIPIGSFLGNTIELKTGGEGATADTATAWHEFTHYIETNGFLSSNDIKALDAAIGKDIVTAEDRADYIGNNLSDWQNQKNIRIKRILKKIANFINAVYEFVARTRTARGVLRGIESGTILSEEELSGINEFAQAGVRYQMAGQKAVGAPTGQLTKAKEMIAKGVDKKQVWEKTGWVQGVEGKNTWKFEIDDSGAKLKDLGLGKQTHKLDAVLIHPKLYEAYPKLKEIEVHSNFDIKDNWTSGSYFHGEGLEGDVLSKNRIMLDGNPEEAKTYLFHELQHSIQAFEGFAVGGSPGMMATRKLENGETVYDLYKKVAGEIEARDTAARSKLTSEQRREQIPYEAEGIPEDQWIIIKEGGTSFSVEEAKMFQTKPADWISDHFGATEKTNLQKVSEGVNTFKKNWRTKLLDRLHPIHQLGEKAYMMHRLITGVPAMLSMQLGHGNLKLKEGALYVDTVKKGFLPWLRNLKKDEKNLFYWVAAKRAEAIENEDIAKGLKPGDKGWRENWLTRDVRNKIFEKTKNVSDARWNELNEQFQVFNKGVLDLAEEAGLIKHENRLAWEQDFYIPFYRVLEDPKTNEEFLKTPNLNKKYLSSGIKKLLGEKAKIGDPIENIVKNWSRLIEASVRNIARAEAYNYGINAQSSTIDNQDEVLPLLENISKRDLYIYYNNKDKHMTYVTPKGNTNILSFMDKGKPIYFKVNDPELYNALSDTNIRKFDGIVSKMFGTAKRILTYSATFGPAFKVANMLRDSLHTAIISKSFVPFIDSAKGFVKSMKEDQDWVKFMASGAGFGGGYIDTQNPEATSKYINKIIKKEGASAGDRILDTPKKVLAFWEKIGSASENAARVMLYKKQVEKGATHLVAGFDARDIMDFTMSGTSEIVQFLIQTVPFMNARAQGLYKLGRAASANPKSFALKGGILSLASLALFAINKDKEEWEELEEWDKRTYYHFWIGDLHYRIPKPFETGAIFSTIIEGAAEVATDNEDFSYFIDTLSNTILDTFAMNPVPQLLKPAFEQWANKSFFTDRPIVGRALQRLKVEEQKDPWTSMTMQLAGKAGVSPKRAEALLRGYASTLGMFLLGISDAIVYHVADFPEKPSMKIDDYMLFGRFLKDKESPRHTKHMTSFYDLFDEVDKTVATINFYKQHGDYQKAIKLSNKNRKQVIFRESLLTHRKELLKLSKQIRTITLSKTLTAQYKRAMIDRRIKARNKIVSDFHDSFARPD